MLVDGTQNEHFCIINPSSSLVCKLKWIQYRCHFHSDVTFYDPLHSLHDQSGESHRSKVIQDLGCAPLQDRNHCRMFPYLGNCGAGQRVLEQMLEDTSHLLSTVP